MQDDRHVKATPDQAKAEVTRQIEKVIDQLAALNPPTLGQGDWSRIEQDQAKIETLRQTAQAYALALLPDDIRALLTRVNDLASEKHGQILGE